MFTSHINFKNFDLKKNTKKLKKDLKFLLNQENEVIKSLGKKYEYTFNTKILKKYKSYSNFRLFGMGGSILGAQAIYDFLKHKIKKKFTFINNLNSSNKKKNNSRFLNLIVSKSGNTLETIFNTNILIKKNRKVYL